MTEQSKIDRNAARRAHKSASLFERADAIFGLEGMGSEAVPSDLPRGKVPPSRSVPPRVETLAAASPQSAPAQPAAPHSVPDVEQAVALNGLRVTIDREDLRDAGLIVPEEPVTGLLEEFRIVKRELLADARASGTPASRRILVCSPHPGEGKTYCATNLAISLAAERDLEVVLVDADVINPSIARRLGLEPSKGLMDALANPNLRPENLVSPTDIEGLFIMQAGTSSVLDAEYLTSARTGEVLDRLTRGAPNRIVIFDTPPALAASPAAELAAHVGQALLVVRADETSRAALEDARQLLSACPDIKLLLNAAQFSPSGRRFGDYGDKGE